MVTTKLRVCFEANIELTQLSTQYNDYICWLSYTVSYLLIKFHVFVDYLATTKLLDEFSNQVFKNNNGKW